MILLDNRTTNKILIILDDDDVLSISTNNTCRSALHRRALMELGQLTNPLEMTGVERPSIIHSTRPAISRETLVPAQKPVSAPTLATAVTIPPTAAMNAAPTTTTHVTTQGEKEKGIGII